MPEETTIKFKNETHQNQNITKLLHFCGNKIKTSQKAEDVHKISALMCGIKRIVNHYFQKMNKKKYTFPWTECLRISLEANFTVSQNVSGSGSNLTNSTSIGEDWEDLF